MLAFTLAPREDEIWFSVASRHAAMLGRTDAADVNCLLHGFRSSAVCPDRASGLEHAARALGLPAGGRSLLMRHTAHPYSFAFAERGRELQVEAWALRREGRAPNATGVMADLLLPPPFLAICPQCVQAAGRAGGANAWLRPHQLPGVFACHLHGDPLRPTAVARAVRRGASAYIPLTEDVIHGARAPTPLVGRHPHAFVAVARISARLLAGELRLEPAALQAGLRSLLGGWVWERARSLLATSRLVDDLLGSPRVVPILRAMGVPANPGTWATALHGLLHRDGAGKSPLLVILLLEAVGATLDDLADGARRATLTLSTREAPIDAGSRIRSDPVTVVACANHACVLWDANAVHAFAAVGPPGRRAECPACGFAVRAPARAGARPVVARTCASWDNAVGAALADRAVSLRTVSVRFGVSTKTVMRAAKRVDAWRPEWAERPGHTDRERARAARLKAAHRAAWAAHAACPAPPMPVKELPKAAFNAYRWLLRHDAAWLRGNDGPGPGRWRSRPSNPGLAEVEQEREAPWPRTDRRETHEQRTS